LVCVNVVPSSEALDAGLNMRRIDTFTFFLGDTTQKAIDGNQKADVLTSYDPAECLDKVLCNFKTILKAAFYGGTGVQQVNGAGVATLMFAGSSARRLEGDRELQDDDGAGAAEFELAFSVNPAEPIDESSAASVAYGVVAALIGSALMMM